MHAAPQLDANLFRDFYINDRHKLQFKISEFNALNTPLYGGPTPDPANARFGMVRVSQNNLP